jgi:FtsP/CotA-like multicopper oxidase with cupredoxin domain
MRSPSTLLTLFAGLLAALIAPDTNGIELVPFWSRICGHPETAAAEVASPAAHVLPTVKCPPAPTTFNELPSIGGSGNASVSLDVGYDPLTQRLCFTNHRLTEAPVIHVGAGHSLTFKLTNTLHDTGAHKDLNCGIQVFGGEGICVRRPQFKEEPGADATYYPIEANQQHTADGTTSLHTHGLFVSPQPCSDEVLHSTVYPANWILPVVPPPPCQAAADEFTYTYDLPADHPSGLYWYHTHRHGMSEQETQMGLVGAIVVEDEGDRHRRSIGVTDEVLVVTDTPIATCVTGPSCDVKKKLIGATPATAAGHAAAVPRSLGPDSAPPLDPRIDEVDQAGGCAQGAVDDTGGYELWTLLLNGVPLLDAPNENWPPDSEVISKVMQPGQRQIFRMVNAAADSFIAPRLTLLQDGVLTVQRLEVFARDGVGLADKNGHRHFRNVDVAAVPLVVPPSGRIEFVVHAPPPGATLYLDTTQVAPGCGGNQYPPRRFMRITSAGTPVDPGDPDDHDLLTGSARLDAYLSTLDQPATVSRTFVLTEYGRGFTYGLTDWLTGPPAAGDYDPSQVDFFLTEVAASDGSVNPAKTALIPFNAHDLAPQVTVHLHGKSSVTEEWLVQNATLEIHAFHMHQIHFRDITKDSTDPDLQPVLDVVTVPAARLVGDISTGYPGKPGWKLLKMTFTTADIGEFVFHCHILEHEDNGMMAKVKVVAD